MWDKICKNHSVYWEFIRGPPWYVRRLLWLVLQQTVSWTGASGSRSFPASELLSLPFDLWFYRHKVWVLPHVCFKFLFVRQPVCFRRLHFSCKAIYNSDSPLLRNTEHWHCLSQQLKTKTKKHCNLLPTWSLRENSHQERSSSSLLESFKEVICFPVTPLCYQAAPLTRLVCFTTVSCFHPMNQ